MIERFVDRLRRARTGGARTGGRSSFAGRWAGCAGSTDYPFLAVRIGHEVDEERWPRSSCASTPAGTELTQADFILTMLSVFREAGPAASEAVLRQWRASCLPTGRRVPTTISSRQGPDQLLQGRLSSVGFQRGRLQSVLALLAGPASDGGRDADEGGARRQLRQAQRWRSSNARPDQLARVHQGADVRRVPALERDLLRQQRGAGLCALPDRARTMASRTAQLRTTIARLLLHVVAHRPLYGIVRNADHPGRSVLHRGEDGGGVPRRASPSDREDADPRLLGDHAAAELATSAPRGPGLFAYAAALCLLNARVPPFVEASSGREQKAAVFRS